mgnify:CR=1 FL=1
MPKNLAIIISFFSLIASWLAIAMSFRGNSIAKRSLKISEDQAKGRSPLLVPYLVNSYFLTDSERSKRIYGFWVSITNRSDTDNSIVRIQLHMKYRRIDQPEAVLVLPHDLSLKTFYENITNNVMAVPQKIASHETKSGLVLFEYDSIALDEIVIDSHEIVFTDSNDLKTNLKPIVITEIIDENK